MPHGDISATALEWAAGVSERTHVELPALGQSFPNNQLDLVYTLCPELPLYFLRDQVLKRAAEAVAFNSLLLIMQHAWSWNQNHTYVTAVAEGPFPGACGEDA